MLIISPIFAFWIMCLCWLHVLLLKPMTYREQITAYMLKFFALLVMVYVSLSLTQCSASLLFVAIFVIFFSQTFETFPYLLLVISIMLMYSWILQVIEWYTIKQMHRWVCICSLATRTTPYAQKLTILL